MPPKTLLDISTVWAYMRGEPIVITRGEMYTNAHGKLNFSVMTRFEILKTPKAKDAAAHLRAFDRLCTASNIFELTGGIVEQASDRYLHI